MRRRAFVAGVPLLVIGAVTVRASARRAVRPPLLGTWRGEMAGGPMGGATREVRFTRDRYEMTGYPSAGEHGRYRVLSRADRTLRVRFEERLVCGPCEAAGPDREAPARDLDVVLSVDGRSITLDGWTLARQR